mgnify:FL=1
MPNTELTLDQLQTINGGAAFMKLGDIKGEYRQIVHPAFKTGFHTPFGTARSKESFGSFQPREVKSVEIGEPPEPKLWLQLLK